MATKAFEELTRRADALTPEEQLAFLAHLAERIRDTYAATRPRAKWADLCGIVPGPMMGEDAQAWVTRTRRESDG